jgi:opacity protein-like surface antigen
MRFPVKIFATIFSLVLIVLVSSGEEQYGPTQSTLPPNGRPQPSFIQRLYADSSFGYISSRHFNGLNGAVRGGYALTRRHHFEIEADFSYLHCSGYSYQGGIISLKGMDNGFIEQQRTVRLYMIPVMLNYRYIFHFGKRGWASKILAYAGFGIGVNFVNWENEYNVNTYEDDYSLFESTRTTSTENKIEFACQGFAGMGYQFTERWALTGGLRLFNTQRFSFGGEQYPNNANVLTPLMRPMSLYWIAEVGLHYGF